MSLKVWLPLNGDLHNQGCAPFTISSIEATPTFTTGKIGQCYQRTNSNSQLTNGLRIEDNLIDLFGSTASIAVWVKPLNTHTHYNGTILSSGNWNQKKWAFGVSQDNTKVDVLCGNQNTYINCTVPVNEWTHLVSIYDNGTCTLYKNGVYIGQLTGQKAFETDATWTGICRETYASGYFGFCGCINDLRIYDHCLSAAEVHEISQGLVLHYKLDNNGHKNLFTSDASRIMTIGANDTTKYSDYTYIDPEIKNNGIFKEGTEYTITYDYTVNTLNTGSNVYLYSQLNMVRCAPTNAITDIRDGIMTGHVVESFQITADQAAYENTFRVRWRLAGGTGGDSVTLTNVRLYLGRPEEISYISDCSGYNYHSTLNKSANIIANTARYSCATHFGAYQTPYSILIDTSVFPALTNCTITWWEYCLNSGNTLLFTGHTTSYYIGAGSTSSRLYDSNVGTPIIYKDGVAETNHSSNGTTNYHTDVFHTQNSWHHYALVGANLSAWTAFKINNYSSNWPLNAYLSDIRIYSTELSATDIKQLYEMGAKVDNKQNLHIYEAVEMQPTIKLTKQGQMKAGEFQEDTATRLYETNQIIETNNLIEF